MSSPILIKSFPQLTALTWTSGSWWCSVRGRCGGKELTARARALGFGNGGTGLFVGLLDFGHKRRNVFVAGFLEQILL